MKSSCLIVLLFVLGPMIELSGQSSDILKEKLSRNLPQEERLEVLKSLITLLLSEDKAQVKSVYLPMLHEEVIRSGSSEYLAYETEVNASLLYLGGQIDSARITYQRAREYYMLAGKTDKALNTYSRVGIMYSLKGDYGKAEQIYREVMVSGAAYNDVMSYVYNQMGTVLQYRGIKDSALYYYGKSIELYGRLKDTAGMMRPMHNSATLLTESGKKTEAIELLLKVKSWRERKKMYRDLYNTVNAISTLYLDMGEYVQAMDYAEQAYRYAVHQKNNALVIAALGNIALVNSEISDHENAVRYLDQAVKIAESIQSTDDQLSMMCRLGLAWMNAGKHDFAAGVLERAMEIISNSGPSRVGPNVMVSLGQAYLLQGRLDQARELLNKGIELAKSMGQEEIRNSGIGMLGRIYLLQNKPREAIKAAGTAYEYLLKESFKRNQLDPLATLYEAYKQTGNYKMALLMLERYRALKDSLNSTDRVRQYAVKTQQFEFRLERERAAAEQQQRESALRARAIQNEIIAVSVIILGILGLFYFLNVRSKNRVISRKNEELESLNSTKDQMFAIIGHDLRKPALSLRGISGKVNYLINRKEFDMLNKLGAQIEQQAQSMHQLTDNLLVWALSQRNTLKVKSLNIDLAGLLQDALLPLEPLAQTKNIELKVELPALQVVSDPDILQIIIRNLTDNAIKFTNPGGMVHIGAGEMAKGFYLEISDTGIGMSSDLVAQTGLLEGSVSESGTAGEKGAGLGLRLVRELTDRLSGEVKITSTENKGTSVRVEFCH